MPWLQNELRRLNLPESSDVQANLCVESTVENSEPMDPLQRPVPLSLCLLAALVVHLPLLLMKMPLKSYDTNFHIFFASHYFHHWFDPWNVKWFCGFSQATYPPLAHQWVAALSLLFGFDYAYMAVQMAAILLLVVGVYRFSLLWVSPRAASLAALASVFVGAESFLVYNAGQLPTTTAAPLYLNALPFLFDWVRKGKASAFVKGWLLFTAAAADHHATLLVGSFFFGLPVLALALLERVDGKRISVGRFVTRTAAITIAVGISAAIVLLPYFIALAHYPITQTPIPHESRANYILSLSDGVIYFIIPYGALILALPFIFLEGCQNVRLRPLFLGFWVAFLLGLGGTTPVGPILLGRAFDVLTMERFSYWATLLALPIIGVLATRLIRRFRVAAAASLAVLAAFSCALAVAWAAYRPADPLNINVDPVADWLNRDGHDQYRYFTLGFGNEISRLSMLTDAESVDGEWYSGRMLPELMKNGGASLTISRYFGISGINALRAILRHSDRYGVKWVFVRDHYYDPLLAFGGFRPVDYLEDKTITVWSKDGVPPAQPVYAPQRPPHWQGVMWGTLPFGSSILAIVVLLIPERKRRYADTEVHVVPDHGVAARSLAS